MASSCQHLHICIFCNQWELSTKIVLLVSIHLCGWGQGQHWVPLSPLGKAELGGSFPEISVDGLLLLERSQWDPKCHDARAQRWAAVPCWPQQQKASPWALVLPQGLLCSWPLTFCRHMDSLSGGHTFLVSGGHHAWGKVYSGAPFLRWVLSWR